MEAGWPRLAGAAWVLLVRHRIPACLSVYLCLSGSRGPEPALAFVLEDELAEARGLGGRFPHAHAPLDGERVQVHRLRRAAVLVGLDGAGGTPLGRREWELIALARLPAVAGSSLAGKHVSRVRERGTVRARSLAPLREPRGLA